MDIRPVQSSLGLDSVELWQLVAVIAAIFYAVSSKWMYTQTNKYLKKTLDDQGHVTPFGMALHALVAGLATVYGLRLLKLHI